MADLLLVVPSRGRPGNIERLWSAMQETCTAATGLLVGLDSDDPLHTKYPAGPDYWIADSLRHVVPWVNFLASRHCWQSAAVGHIGDDNVPRTRGWDTAILEALQITPFAFANDLYPRAPGSLCCHIFTRSDLVMKLGYLGPPAIQHMFVDPVWMAWGRACGITYLHEVVIEHMHWSNGKAAGDQVYQDAASCWDGDLAAYHEYCRAQLNADIAKLGGVPYTPETLAQFNASLGIR